MPTPAINLAAVHLELGDKAEACRVASATKAQDPGMEGQTKALEALKTLAC